MGPPYSVRSGYRQVARGLRFSSLFSLEVKGRSTPIYKVPSESVSSQALPLRTAD